MWESVCLKVTTVFTSVTSVFTSGFQRRLQCNADLSSAQARNVNISSFFKWISLSCHWFSYIYVGILSILSHHWFLKACEHMFQMREGRKKNWQVWFLRVEKRCLFFFIYALSKILNTSKDKSIASTMHFITTKIWALAEPSKVSVLFTVFWTFLRTFDFPESASWSSKHVFLGLATSSASRSSPLISDCDKSTKIQKWKKC